MESRFLDDMGSFRIEHGEKNRLNYFPLAAENGVMASITPELKGDLKRDQNSFVLPPASEEDLRSGMAGRLQLSVSGGGFLRRNSPILPA